MVDCGHFILWYWEYFLELEKQFLLSKKYVEFDNKNDNTFSREYLQLIFSICSEIDVIGKIIARENNPNFKIDFQTNIKKWGFEVQEYYPEISNKTIYFNNRHEIMPFKNWRYEKYTTKNCKTNLRLEAGCKTLFWWKAYDSLKHARILYENKENNYIVATYKNVKTSLGALYLLEQIVLRKQKNFIEAYKKGIIKNSNLFMFDMEEVYEKRSLNMSDD